MSGPAPESGRRSRYMRGGGCSCVLSAILVVAALPALDAESEKDKWKWGVELEATSRYDSNVFRFSDDQIDRFEEGRSSDKTSGRFDDIHEVDDFVLTPRFEFVVKGDGLYGKKLEARAEGKVDYFTLNTARTHPSFAFEVSQSLGGGESVELDLRYSLGRFSRNYLSDATDLSGSVSASERVYSAGIFDSGAARLKYSRRLWKRSKKRTTFLDRLGLREIEGAARIGYGMRDYEGPFPNRDRDQLTVGLDLDMQIAKRWRLELGYRFRYIATPGGREVMIRDEADFGVDFNADLDITDESLRTVQRADRSRLDHGVGFEIGWEISKRWETWIGYEITLQHYLSDERFDLSYRDREDLRRALYAGVEWEFSKSWSARMEGEWTSERSERLSSGDEDEETEYEGYIVYMSLAMRF